MCILRHIQTIGNIRTLGLQITLLTLILSNLGTLPLLASELDEALNKQNQAAKDYIQARRKLGNQITSQEKKELYKKTIQSAQVQALTAKNHETANQAQEGKKSILQTIAKRFPISKWLKSTPKSESKGQNPAKTSSSEPYDSSLSREPASLDGSDIPKEIEFPGKKPTEKKPLLKRILTR